MLFACGLKASHSLVEILSGMLRTCMQDHALAGQLGTLLKGTFKYSNEVDTAQSDTG